MAICDIKGVPVRFPFEPYDIQKTYMEKVIDCLQNQTNGILESPTGTGKTLSLLCSSLAWLEVKKAQIQAQRLYSHCEDKENDFLNNLNKKLNEAGGKQVSGRAFLGLPTIIYASRTHTQLHQAMQELKRTEYKHMKAYVMASREQTCVHPEIRNEQNNANKVNLCRLKVKERSCMYYNAVERKKDDPAITDLNVIDIEDIVKLGETHRFCPYYMAKELKQRADIIFVPYNYILDPRARKALGIELSNSSVVILDEAHNIDKVCEESASLQIKSTDITLCIDEVTAVMKAISDDIPIDFNDQEVPRDFTAEELCVLKQMFLDFEQVLDEVPLKSTSPEDTNFEGTYIFEMLDKAGINFGNSNQVINLIEKMVQFLTVIKVGDGPFQRKGTGLQIFSELLIIAFAGKGEDFRNKIQRCYKVHITVEEPRRKGADSWFAKAANASVCRVLSFWCFSPGFGMNMLTDQGLHCVILTSGTLAPLKPLISELELTIGVQIENPHIVKGDQVCVKILTKGPDNEILNSNFQNRDNPKYMTSLGRTILNLIRIIPDGVLVFFPSYPIMQKCQQHWQETGIWNGICQQKPIYVEPKDKTSFNVAMTEYYAKINDPKCSGAIFMGVCRGKVSEGLDFADINGRAVFITGLPYPPLKDPRVILKKRYLDICNARDKEYLKGNDWYSLEATRAVNQAIGRVIRHRHDFGAIILLDTRFTNPAIKNNLSKWLREHIKVVQNFGEIVRDLRGFFKYAQDTLPAAKLKLKAGAAAVPAEFEIPGTRKIAKVDSFDSPSSSSSDGLVSIHKRKIETLENPLKKKKITVVQNPKQEVQTTTTIKEYIIMVKKALDQRLFDNFVNALKDYKLNKDIKQLLNSLDEIFATRHNLRYIINGLELYIRQDHKEEFLAYCANIQ